MARRSTYKTSHKKIYKKNHIKRHRSSGPRKTKNYKTKSHKKSSSCGRKSKSYKKSSSCGRKSKSYKKSSSCGRKSKSYKKSSTKTREKSKQHGSGPCKILKLIMEENNYEQMYTNAYLNCKRTKSKKKFSRHKIKKLPMTREIKNSIKETIKELQKTPPKVDRNENIKKRKRNKTLKTLKDHPQQYEQITETVDYEPIIDPSKYEPGKENEIILAQGRVDRSVERLQEQLDTNNAAYVNENPIVYSKEKAYSYLQGIDHFCKALLNDTSDEEQYIEAVEYTPHFIALIRREYRHNKNFPDLIQGNSIDIIVDNCEKIKGYLAKIITRR